MEHLIATIFSTVVLNKNVLRTAIVVVVVIVVEVIVVVVALRFNNDQKYCE